MSDPCAKQQAEGYSLDPKAKGELWFAFCDLHSCGKLCVHQTQHSLQALAVLGALWDCPSVSIGSCTAQLRAGAACNSPAHCQALQLLPVHASNIQGLPAGADEGPN